MFGCERFGGNFVKMRKVSENVQIFGEKWGPPWSDLVFGVQLRRRMADMREEIRVSDLFGPFIPVQISLRRCSGSAHEPFFWARNRSCAAGDG